MEIHDRSVMTMTAAVTKAKKSTLTRNDTEPADGSLDVHNNAAFLELAMEFHDTEMAKKSKAQMVIVLRIHNKCANGTLDMQGKNAFLYSLGDSPIGL